MEAESTGRLIDGGGGGGGGGEDYSRVDPGSKGGPRVRVGIVGREAGAGGDSNGDRISAVVSSEPMAARAGAAAAAAAGAGADGSSAASAAARLGKERIQKLRALFDDAARDSDGDGGDGNGGGTRGGTAESAGHALAAQGREVSEGERRAGEKERTTSGEGAGALGKPIFARFVSCCCMYAYFVCYGSPTAVYIR